jgi:thioredoxin 1
MPERPRRSATPTSRARRATVSSSSTSGRRGAAPAASSGPIIEDLAGEYAGRVRVGKLNVDDNQTTAMSYRVMSIPTVILFKDGEPVETIVGAMPKGAYQQRLDKHVPAAAN